MVDDLSRMIARVDEFPDYSGRALVTLTDDAQLITETWSMLDPEADLAIQHQALAKRIHRLLKVRVRHYLNGLALACSWQTRCGDLSRTIVASGFDSAKLYLHGVFDSVAGEDLSRRLEKCCEEARLAGFVSASEIDQLAQGEAIAVTLDPRPTDVPIGPPIVVMEMEL